MLRGSGVSPASGGEHAGVWAPLLLLSVARHHCVHLPAWAPWPSCCPALLPAAPIVPHTPHSLRGAFCDSQGMPPRPPTIASWHIARLGLSLTTGSG